jgi:uncharacterized protein
MARWLLDHGASILQTGPRGGGSIIGAVNEGNLEMVKLLIDRGADPNATYGQPPRNALSHAVMFGHADIVDYLRGIGVAEPGLIALQPTGTLRDDFLQYMEHCCGKTSGLALSEIVPVSSPQVSLHIIEPKHRWQKKLVFTTGMSDEAMKVPPGSERFRFAELGLYLPNDWPLDLKSLRAREISWPFDWIRRIARYPHENKTWLGDRGTIISNGTPPGPFAPSTSFCAWLLIESMDQPESFEAKDGRTVIIYVMFPLYPEERELGLSKGVNKLVDRFDKDDIEFVIDTSRPNVASK